MHQKILLSLTLIFSLTLAISGQSKADIVVHGDFAGDNVLFQNVTEGNSEPGNPVLYGSPAVVADTLIFNTLTFRAQADGSIGNNVVDGGLSYTAVAGPGREISEIRLSESGDFSSVGFPSSTIDGLVRAEAFAAATPFGGSTVNSSASFEQTSSGSGSGFWDLDVVLSGFSAASVDFSLDNVLTALQRNSSTANIAKKRIEISVVTVPSEVSVGVPEPTSGLLLAGVAVVGLARRRRR